MDKRKLHHQYRFIKKLQPRYFLIAAVFFLALGVFGMRSNYVQMSNLREKVYLADENGEDIEKPLRDLREYVYSHMNTDLSRGGNVSIKPPIQLKHTYDRLVKQEQERVKEANKRVKEEGERECADKFPQSGLNTSRVNCVAEYTRVNTTDPKLIPAELYKFDFISPTWSADFAGLSLLASLFFFAIFIIRLILGWLYKHKLS